MRINMLLFLIFIGQINYGQDTVFFNSEWNPTSKENAEFFRLEKKEGEKWIRSDFFSRTKQIQMKGVYSALDPDIKDGHFEWYHPNGKQKHTGNYVNGKEVGEHLWYSDNGSLEAKENYSDGLLNGPFEEYYPNGNLMDKSSFAAGLQNGWTEYFKENGTKQSEGNFKQGNRDGEWKFFDETGKVEGTTFFKIEFEIKEANMFLQLPNDEWYLSDKSGKDLVQYIFKRNEIVNSRGMAVIPAIMLYIEDAKVYNQDLVVYSIQKRLAFTETSIKIAKIMTPGNNDFPFPFKNAMVMIASYKDQGVDHIFYMIYIITKEEKGIQLYMDMTKDIAAEYEQEFWTTLKTIKELK